MVSREALKLNEILRNALHHCGHARIGGGRRGSGALDLPRLTWPAATGVVFAIRIPRHEAGVAMTKGERTLTPTGPPRPTKPLLGGVHQIRQRLFPSPLRTASASAFLAGKTLMTNFANVPCNATRRCLWSKLLGLGLLVVLTLEILLVRKRKIVRGRTLSGGQGGFVDRGLSSGRCGWPLRSVGGASLLEVRGERKWHVCGKC
jgi:hypothetical protein